MAFQGLKYSKWVSKSRSLLLVPCHLLALKMTLFKFLSCSWGGEGNSEVYGALALKTTNLIVLNWLFTNTLGKALGSTETQRKLLKVGFSGLRHEFDTSDIAVFTGSQEKKGIDCRSGPTAGGPGSLELSKHVRSNCVIFSFPGLFGFTFFSLLPACRDSWSLSLSTPPIKACYLCSTAWYSVCSKPHCFIYL